MVPKCYQYGSVGDGPWNRPCLASGRACASADRDAGRGCAPVRFGSAVVARRRPGPAGRDWLGEQLQRAGVQVDRVLAYQRGVPVWSDAQLARAGAAVNDGTVWLFSSSEAIANLLDRLRERDWSAARAVATHPRIAASARRAGFGVVCESRPTLEAVMSSIKSSG